MLNFAYKSLLISEEDSKRREYSDMSGTPLHDFYEDPAPAASSMRALGEVLSVLKALGSRDSLSDHIWKYFHRKALRYSLCAAPTCLAGLKSGFAVGLRNGDVFVGLGTMAYTLTHYEAEVTSLVSGLDDLGGVYLVSGAKDGTIQVWHLEKSQELQVGLITPKRKSLPVSHLRIAKDNSGFLAAFSDGTILLSDISCQDSKSIGKAHEDPLVFLEIAPSCEWFLTAPRKSCVKLWAWNSGKLLYTLNPESREGQNLPFQDDILAVHVSRENELFVFGELSSAAVVLMRNCSIAATIPLEYGRKGRGERLVHSIAAADRLLSVYSDMTFSSESFQRATIWTKQVPASPFPHLILHTDSSVCLLSPNFEVSLPISGKICEISLLNDLLGTVSDQEMVIYRLSDNWKTRFLLSGIAEISPSDSGSLLISTERQLLRLTPGLDANPKLIYTLGDETAMGFGPDGKYALLVTPTAVQFLAVESGLVERSFDLEDCQKAVLSPRSEFLFLYSREGVQIRSLLQETVVITHPGDPSEFIYSVVFSRNNNFAAMLTNRRTLLWDMRNQTLVLRYSQSTKRNGLFSAHRYYYLEFGLDMNTSLFSINARRRLLESTEKTSHAELCRNDRYCLILRTSIIVILDFPTLIPIAELDQRVESFVLLQGEETILAGGPTSLCVWNVLEGRLVSELPCVPAPLLLSAVPSTPFVLALESEDTYEVLNTKWYLELATEPDPDLKRIKIYGPDQVFTLAEAYFQLGEFVCGGPYHPQLASCMVTPYKLNGLHIIAYMNAIDLLPAALKAGTPVIRGTFGSPITVAIERKTRRCLEAILKHIISLRAQSVTAFIAAVQSISEDMLDLIRSGSNNLMCLFKALVLENVQGAMLSQFLSPVSRLPIIHFDDSLFVSPREFGNTGTEYEAEMMLITFSICALKWNFEPGSSDSIALLKALANTKVTDILKTRLVNGFVTHKWKSLWLIIAAYAFLYFLMLLLLVIRLFDLGRTGLVCQSFLMLNAFFLVHEGFQARTLGLEYLRDWWNYVDIVRAGSCIVWILMSLERPDVSVFGMIVAGLCFLRGLTHFRAFSGTRYYVRMVLDVIKEASTFIILLFYTTFAFGILYSIASYPQILSPQAAWQSAYELNMGHIDLSHTNSLQWSCFMLASLVNVIVMLNLLVSILGDAFEKVQARNVEADVREMIETVLEYESLMVWRRTCGEKQFLQVCSEGFQEEVEEDQWKGRADAIKKKVIRVSKQLQTDLKAATEEIKQEMRQGFARLEESVGRKVVETGSMKSTREALSAHWQVLEGQIRAWAPSFS